ncbi:isocitrate lyase/PEP mutase family protein [Bosea sp. (in: a-proteobacteria)]|uniref:isocitrate lyase/PEP mutase family protein n=1 Tax=Bosea sp. (in: a-proteobacteria) TaxID=1871050 RepID=UPI00261FAAD1|nr:isocitrate lyase/PEP mutase family protein [Bosea sp. (in: a-proteobacteria)]MCO5091265.1 isocitrate lyase/PEP mutase family protein [Bosea sp. (in: a-proteobacteria)]
MSAQRKNPTWRELMAQNKPLVLPGAHDAFSARLIADAGFPAYFIGGFPVIGARYGLPDIGLVGLGEMHQNVSEMMAASALPVLVDADDGYGDVKNVVRTTRAYERLGASAIFFEDQVAPKRCGHMAGKVLVPTETMEAKLRAAAAAREDKEFFIIARTDARDVEGLDAAFRRAERYLKAGADGLFIESPRSVEELGKIGGSFGVPHLANMLEGGVTPILSNAELGEMGFSMIIHGINLLMRSARVMKETLAALREDKLKPDVNAVSFEEYKRLVGFGDWADIDNTFRS